MFIIYTYMCIYQIITYFIASQLLSFFMTSATIMLTYAELKCKYSIICPGSRDKAAHLDKKLFSLACSEQNKVLNQRIINHAEF